MEHAHPELQVLNDVLTTDKILYAIHSQKNYRAPGIDRISVKMKKYCQVEQTVEQTLDWPAIRDAMTVIWRRRNDHGYFRKQLVSFCDTMIRLSLA